jgi:hypothetical protein
MHAVTQSQHPWIIASHILSPEVQVTVHPSLVISHLHMPMVRLQQQTIIPFIMQHMLHIPPAIMVHRFCIMAQAAGSSQVQVIFIPPAHFSTFIVQRGTITMFGAIAGADAPPIPVPPIPDMPVIGRSIIIVPVMLTLRKKRTATTAGPEHPTEPVTPGVGHLGNGPRKPLSDLLSPMRRVIFHQQSNQVSRFYALFARNPAG